MSAKMKKGGRLVCIPCGREVIVDACGVSEDSLWCCAKPMVAGKPATKTTRKARKAARKKR